MPVLVRVEGVNQLRALGRGFRAAGLEGKGFRKELNAAIEVASRPGIAAVRLSARGNLPKAGGLNEYVAKSNIKARTRLTGNAVGVRIAAVKGRHNLPDLDEGTARHPVFGNRDVWESNAVTPGWFTQPLERMRPVVGLGVLGAISRAKRALERL